MRSAWIKWARAVEHQRVLARSSREFVDVDAHEYVRADNAGDHTDPHITVQWRIRIKQPYPEHWSVLIGDILTNLRAALDHTLWAAVLDHSGPPAQPHRVQFPITTKPGKFTQAAAVLQPLVAADVWGLIEALQPFHGGEQAHTSPLEILRWLCNVDKHRTVHVVGRTAVDLAPILVQSATPLEVVEQWHHEGPADDDTVVANLTVKRPAHSQPVDLCPTFTHLSTLQVSDDPVEYRSVASLMPAMSDAVLQVVTYTTSLLGQPPPAMDSLELGEEHEAVAAGNGGNTVTVHGIDGSVRRMSVDQPVT